MSCLATNNNVCEDVGASKIFMKNICFNYKHENTHTSTLSMQYKVQVSQYTFN